MAIKVSIYNVRIIFFVYKNFLSVPVRHLAVTGGDMYYVQYKDGSWVERDFL